MFEVERMTKTRVLCAKHELDAVVDALYEFGAIHVTRSKTFQPGSPLAKLESVSRMLVKMRALESILGLSGVQPRPASASASASAETLSLSRLEKEFNALPLDELDALAKKKQDCEEELNELEARRKELRAFKDLDIDLNALTAKTALLEFAVFEVSGSPTNALEIAKRFGDAVLVHAEAPKPSNKMFALFFKGRKQNPRLLVAWDKRRSEKARAALATLARETGLPQAQESFAREHARVEERIAGLRRELAGVRQALDFIASKHGAAIVSLRKALEIEFKKAELPTQFGQSELTAAAEGWVPAKRFPELKRVLDERLGKRVFVERVETSETPPSMLKNFFAVRPFEFMTAFFSLPRYLEIDPTFFTALTFPLFFGMILGDLGYGLVLFLLGLALFSKFKKGFLHTIAGMLLLSSVSTMVFGFVYVEFFGKETVFGLLELHPFISRMHEHGIQLLFAAAVLTGFLHITLGLALGVWQGVREKHLKHSAAKLSWLLVLWGFAAFLANSMDLIFTRLLGFVKIVLPPPLDLGALAVGVVGLAVFEGVIQLFEIPTLFSNVLSYLRIMALGLSAAALAGIVAGIPLDFGALASLQPMAVVSFVLFLALVLLGHAMAIALGLLEAGIQSLRLHYVEFYSKFYKGGGTAFTPLREEE